MSGVGSEEVEFEPAIPLEGKVEIYMQVKKPPASLRVQYGTPVASKRVVRVVCLVWCFGGPRTPIISLPLGDLFPHGRAGLSNRAKSGIARTPIGTLMLGRLTQLPIKLVISCTGCPRRHQSIAVQQPQTLPLSLQ